MCVRTRTGCVIPELTVRVARASNPRGTTAMAIRDHLNGLWDDEDFEEWYPRDGKPGLSPAQLATVSVLQFLLELSDRQAAESVRNRIDFKYAMGMDLEDPGFHHSVLADFRERLTEEGRADKLLDLALEKIRAVGLVRERGRQRTDSTHVLAAVRDLTRLELVTEAMRATLEELARRAPHELVGLVTEDWGKRYGRAARLGKNPSKPKTRIKETGEDVRLLLHVHRYLPALRGGEQVQALRQIFVQNYFIDTQDRPKWRETEGAGLPPSAVAIVSPYDLSARYARRGETRWKGFLAHVTETCDPDAPSVITDVTTTKAAVHDTKALPGIMANLNHRNLLSKEHFVDGGYLSVALKQQVAHEHGVGLVGPIRARSTRQSRKGTVFHREAFTINWDAKEVTCPQGNVSRRWSTPPSRALRQCRVLPGRLPPVPGEGRLHAHRRPEGHLPAARALRHPVRIPDRAADPGMAITLLAAGSRREHDQRVRQRPRHAPVPLPQRREGPRPARSDRHRGQPRTDRRPPTASTRPATPEPHRTPGLPRLAAHPPAPVQARRHPPRRLT